MTRSSPVLTRAQKAAWGLIIGSLLVLGFAVTAPFWLPRLVRSIVPDRYVMAYAPEPVAHFIFQSGRSEMLPTISSDPDAGFTLLEDLAPTISAIPTQLATISVISDTANASSVVSESHPTITPAFDSQAATEVPVISSGVPSRWELNGFNVIGQGYNMCGEATLTMYLSYWGVPVDNRTQLEVANAIKPHPEDSNTSPDELVGYAESLGFSAIVRVNGTTDLLKQFVYAGYPVMIERGFDELPDEGWMGHYMLVTGYSDESRTFTTLDSYWTLKHVQADPAHPVDYWDYDRLDSLWRHFGWTYIVVFPPSQFSEVQGIIGEDVDDATMYRQSAERLSGELTTNPGDVFGWFSLGTALDGLGDYERAALAYDQAQSLGIPFRMMWYQFGMYHAYYQTQQYDKVLDQANRILDVQNYPESEEAFYYRGMVYQARGQLDAARGQFRRALEYNPNFELAQQALDALGN